MKPVDITRQTPSMEVKQMYCGTHKTFVQLQLEDEGDDD